jgi:type I restriction enzyme, S subunit
MNLLNPKLQDFCLRIFSGGTPSTKESSFWNGEFPWLSSGETSQTFIFGTENHISQAGVDNSSTKLASKNSIVMASAGQGNTRGQVSFLQIDTYVNQSLIVIEPDPEKIDPFYLFLNLRSRYNELRGLSDASSIRGSITIPLVSNLPMQLPSLPEQRKVSSLTYDLEMLSSLYARRILVVENMINLIYTEFFGRKQPFDQNGSVPLEFHFRDGRLEDLLQLAGEHVSSDQRAQYLHYCPLDCLPSASMSFHQYQDITKAESSLVSFEKGDILFGAMRPYFHKVCLAPFIGLTRTTCLVLKPKADKFKYFSFCKMFQKNTVDYATAICVGSTMPYVRWSDLKRMRVLIPDDKTIGMFNLIVEPLFQELFALHSLAEIAEKETGRIIPRLLLGSYRL